MVPDRMRKGASPSVKSEPLTCRPTSLSLMCEGLRRARTTLQGQRRRVTSHSGAPGRRASPPGPCPQTYLSGRPSCNMDVTRNLEVRLRRPTSLTKNKKACMLDRRDRQRSGPRAGKERLPGEARPWRAGAGAGRPAQLPDTPRPGLLAGGGWAA